MGYERPFRFPLAVCAAVLGGCLLAADHAALAQSSVPTIVEGPGHHAPNEKGVAKRPESSAKERVVKPRTEEKKAQPKQKKKVRQKRVACSADSLPAAERRRMQAEASRIMRTRGRVAAIAYARQQGMAYHRRLQARGICP
ncbi:hypothetical protein [Shinella sp. BYT-45]|uniref:hypothetical protein n=1 Tax=Shinella sp. BYT-45 TaxID=3377377 RepID=UPI00397FD5BD